MSYIYVKKFSEDIRDDQALKMLFKEIVLKY